ncbi:hypothetical protein F2Q68_00005401 [Brassica cretica]|nr:hypothetical protein F2Q68_00005401 [Brassica cretica]
MRNLDNSPHPINIESGPSPEDRVRCCIKSIKTLGSRQQNKDSPPGAISTDPPIPEKNHQGLRVPTRCTSIPQGRTTKNWPSRLNKGSCARKIDLAYHCNANPRSRIPTSERGNRSPNQNSIDTSDLHQPNLRVLPSIDMQGQDPESP